MVDREPGQKSLESDKFRDKCAVFGAISFTGRDVATDVVLGLGSLQHRAQDGTGIASFHSYSQRFASHKGLGLVGNVFHNPEVLDHHDLRASLSVGHNRYRTSGSDAQALSALQPFVVEKKKESFAIAHNGNIPERELERLRTELPADTPLHTGTDTEILGWRIMNADGFRWEDKIVRGLAGVQGAYALVMATDDGALIGIRDPRGIRPLMIGYTKDGVVLGSETHAFERLDVERVEEVPPGHMVIARDGEVRVEQALKPLNVARCLIEPVYYAHPVSKEGKMTNNRIRERMGAQLAQEFPMEDIDIICGVPESGLPIALGYARALGKYPEAVIVKDRYGKGIRTFIQATQLDRATAVDGKFSVSEDVRGKKIVIIDDSVIRGNTSIPLINMLRKKGATEVHVLSASPPIMHECDLGVDIGSKEDLVAWRQTEFGLVPRSNEEIANKIGADSIGFLSLKGLIEASGRGEDKWCTNCFTGVHPIFDARFV